MIFFKNSLNLIFFLILIINCKKLSKYPQDIALYDFHIFIYKFYFIDTQMFTAFYVPTSSCNLCHGPYNIEVLLLSV